MVAFTLAHFYSDYLIFTQKGLTWRYSQFHSVGGGLYTGTIIFRLSHIHSKRPNMEILTTLLVILTIVQLWFVFGKNYYVMNLSVPETIGKSQVLK